MKMRPVEHNPSCHVALFNGNGICNCGEDQRWQKDYEIYKNKLMKMKRYILVEYQIILHYPDEHFNFDDAEETEIILDMDNDLDELRTRFNLSNKIIQTTWCGHTSKTKFSLKSHERKTKNWYTNGGGCYGFGYFEIREQPKI